MYFYRPQRSCGQGNVFTAVCDSVHRGGVCLSACWDTPQETPQRRKHLQEGGTTPRRRPPRRRHPQEGDPPEGGTPQEGAPRRRDPQEGGTPKKEAPKKETPMKEVPPRRRYPKKETPQEGGTPKKETNCETFQQQAIGFLFVSWIRHEFLRKVPQNV